MVLYSGDRPPNRAEEDGLQLHIGNVDVVPDASLVLWFGGIQTIFQINNVTSRVFRMVWNK